MIPGPSQSPTPSCISKIGPLGSHRSTTLTITVMGPVMRVSLMHVFHQSNCVSAIKPMLFYYSDIPIFVFFHVSVCLLLLPCMLKSTAFRVGVKQDRNQGSQGEFRPPCKLLPPPLEKSVGHS